MCCTSVHVDLGGDALQPVDPGTVSAVVEEGQGEEGGSDRMHAEVSDDLERNDARPNLIQADGHRLRRTGFFPLKVVLLLTFKTIAAYHPSSIGTLC